MNVPMDGAPGSKKRNRIRIRRVWRSQATRLLLFIVISPICIWISRNFPASVISGPLFSIGEDTYVLKLPLFWLIPAFVIGHAIIRIYDVLYVLDSQGIEAKIGILSLDQIITRIRYEDIRSIDSRLSVTDRILGIGSLDIGTAASAGLEISFTGIASPIEVQKLILAERDSRLRKAAKRQGGQEYSNLAAAGGE